VLLAAGGVLFSLALLEAGVRMLHLVPDRFWEPDAVLGARLIPGSAGWWTQEDREFLVPVKINSLGRRDLERGYEKPPATFRVLVLGDSFVEALQVPLEATFPRILEQELAARDGASQRIEVLSAGVSGYGTASELLYFEREGRRYHPDLVILAFYPGNDVKNNSPTLEDTFTPVYAADGSLQKVTGQARPERHGWRANIPRSQAYLYARQLLLLRQPRLAEALVRYGLMRPEAIRRAPERDGMPLEYGVYATTPSAEWQDAWVRTERLLDQLRAAVQAGGARFAVVIVSTREQVYPELWNEVLKAYPPMRQRSWDLEAPQRRIDAWCARNGVPCLALAPAFRTAKAGGSDFLHYRHEGHWTAAGHRLAASLLKQFLEQQQLLPAREQGVTHEGD
jgi:lysophospholipase L1-like esterase